MATTKTLTPTGQTVTIAEMTDRPNNGVDAEGISKLVDAANKLNSEIEKDFGSITASTTLDFMKSIFQLLPNTKEVIHGIATWNGSWMIRGYRYSTNYGVVIATLYAGDELILKVNGDLSEAVLDSYALNNNLMTCHVIEQVASSAEIQIPVGFSSNIGTILAVEHYLPIENIYSETPNWHADRYAAAAIITNLIAGDKYRITYCKIG